MNVITELFSSKKFVSALLSMLTVVGLKFGIPEIQIEEIIALAEKEKPACLIIDSVQTIFTDQLPSAPGSVNQLRA